MGVYAALGVGLALCAFANGAVFAVLVYTASRNLHLDAITRVMHAPMSWFDTTPLGKTARVLWDSDSILTCV